MTKTASYDIGFVEHLYCISFRIFKIIFEPRIDYPCAWVGGNSVSGYMDLLHRDNLSSGFDLHFSQYKLRQNHF